MNRLAGLALPIVMLATSAVAQSNVTTTNGGTANTVPVFTTGTNVENSPISVSGGNVGIGTTSPVNKLDVEGGIIRIGTGYAQYPAQAIIATGSDGHNINIFPSLGGGNYNNIVQAGDQAIIYSVNFPGSGAFVIAPASAGASSGLRMDGAGNVGIGTAIPGAKLEIAGNVKVSGAGASITFPDGTVQSTAYTGATCSTGGDYAESVDVAGDRASYEPGDVMVLAPQDGADVVKSSVPYSTTVAGIYSTKPGYVGRRQLTDPKTATQEIPMAMVGTVPTKVSAENGPIHRGDLLVTSSTPGFAMKGTDRSRMTGAIVGKAMGALESGTGVIEVLVSLQ